MEVQRQGQILSHRESWRWDRAAARLVPFTSREYAACARKHRSRGGVWQSIPGYRVWGNAALLRCVALSLSPRRALLLLRISRNLSPFVSFVSPPRFAARRCAAGAPALPAPLRVPAPGGRAGAQPAARRRVLPRLSALGLSPAGRCSSGAAAAAALLPALAPYAGQGGETEVPYAEEPGEIRVLAKPGKSQALNNARGWNKRVSVLTCVFEVNVLSVPPNIYKPRCFQESLAL